MAQNNRKKRRLGAEIVQGLTELCDVVAQGECLDAKFTVRTVELKLEPTLYDAHDVREIRRSLNVSQAVFAEILATSVECVESWEQGLRTPPPMARRLLDLVSQHRDHWIKVLNDSRKGRAKVGGAT